MNSKSVICPQCGATLKTDNEQGRTYCEYCGYEVKFETTAEKAKKIEQMEYARVYAREKALRDAERGKKAESAVTNFIKILRFIIIAVIVIGVGIGIYEVAGLGREKISPFENIQVTFEGLDGEGRCKVNNPKYGSQVDYDFPSGELSEGEEITIRASSEEYRLTEKNRTYTVTGLDLQITDKEQMTDEVKDYIREQSKGGLDTHGDYGSEISNTPLSIYLIVGSDDSVIIDTYTATFTKDSYSRDYIVAFEYDDVYTSKGISPVIFSNMSRKGYIESIILDKENDHGPASAFDPSYCGAYTCFKSETDLENWIKSEFPGAQKFIRID